MARLSNEELLLKIKEQYQLEVRSTAEMLVYINEVDRRRLYLDLGFTSLFAFLTNELGYTPASAQRRIDAARLMNSVPELGKDIEEGSLNLMQVSMVAQSVRQKKKEDPSTTVDVATILEKVKGEDLVSTQKILAQELDIDIKTAEKTRIQKDESVRLELTFTKEQMATLIRLREVKSHTFSSWSELILDLAQQELKRKDPLREKQRRAARHSQNNPEVHFQTEAAAGQVPEPPTVEKTRGKREHIPASVRRTVFQKFQCCQWKDPSSGQICGSRFRLQIDHIKSVWLGGSNEIGNLQLLCSVHNALKYEQERFVS